MHTRTVRREIVRERERQKEKEVKTERQRQKETERERERNASKEIRKGAEVEHTSSFVARTIRTSGV